jgi:hypothetical protein
VDGPRALSTSAARDRLAGWSRYQLAVGAIVLLAAVCVLVNFPHTMRTLHQRVEVNVSKGTSGRELVATDGLGISQELIEQARVALPRDASYAIADPTPGAPVAQTTRLALAPYLQFALLPRRRVELAKAAWLLCYECDLANIGRPLEQTWSDGNGLVIARVAR